MRWLDISSATGYESYCWNFRPNAKNEDFPGVSVCYGKRPDGKWQVLIEFAGEYIRRGDSVDNKGFCRLQAENLVKALTALWPERALNPEF